MRTRFTRWLATAAILTLMSVGMPESGYAQAKKAPPKAGRGFRQPMPTRGPKRPPLRPGGPGSPNDLMLRLMRMPPEARRRFLSANRQFQALPAGRRGEIQQRLRQLDQMSGPEREALITRYEFFSRLPPGKQDEARSLFGRWSQRPAESQQRMTGAVQRLRPMGEDQRAQALQSDRFQESFDESEQELIREVLKLSDP